MSEWTALGMGGTIRHVIYLLTLRDVSPAKVSK